MNELALFAGAGGGILGGKLLGWRTVCAVEINAFCARRLMQRQNEGHLPPFPIWDDVCSFDGRPWKGIVDVVSCGFPCQDISAATNGAGGGIRGARSGLWGESARIIGEIMPRYLLLENSPMLTIRGLGVVLGDLASMGFNARWGVLGGRIIGSPIPRDRIWIVANASSNKEPRVKTKPAMLRKTFKKNNIWRTSEFSALLDDAKLRVPIITGDERVVDGVDNRVDRFEAIGNGQIPSLVKLAWETLSQEPEQRGSKIVD